jgi:hypothetical protein
MTISGPTPPIGGVNRAAQAYGIARKPAVAPPPAASPAQPGGVDKAVAAGGSEALRGILNDEERAYFEQLAALGPITYGPSRKAGMVPEAPRGLRLDVRA